MDPKKFSVRALDGSAIDPDRIVHCGRCGAPAAVRFPPGTYPTVKAINVSIEGRLAHTIPVPGDLPPPHPPECPNCGADVQA